mmetsp:Transcript_31508/g.53174  ORF Transcript_31508/g.53174 Transcript_31508/m.53174 type:complete len:484 (+) Transcript_31508:83-1534(+)
MKLVLLLIALLSVLSLSAAKLAAASVGKSKLKVKQQRETETKVVVADASVVADTSVVADAEGGGWRGPACIIGGALAHLALGTYYCWGNFQSYSPSHLRFFDGEEHPGSTPDSNYVIPFTIVTQSMLVPISPLIVKAVGASNTMLIGTMLAAGSIYMASFQKTLARFMFFYSLLFGAGIGIAYTAPMGAGWKWMPSAKGLVSGGILTGFGAGGFVFGKIGSKLANPTGANAVNGLFPASVYENFPGMLRKLSVMYAVLGLVGSLMVTEPKAVETTASGPPADLPGLTVGESLTTRQFWTLWFMVITCATAGLNTAAVYKQFAATSDALAGDGFQSLVGGIGALFNGFGRLFWGTVSDKIGFKASFTILSLLQAAAMMTYFFSTGSKMAFLVNTCTLFFTLAGNFSLVPPAVQGVFGPKSGSIVYGLLYTAFASASVGGGILTKAMVKSLGWQKVFQTLGVASLVATGLVSTFTPIASYAGSTM